MLLFASQLQAADKKEYLYMLKAVRPEMLTVGPTEREAAVLKEHAAHLEQLVRDGVLIIGGPTQERDPIGIAIFRASSDEEAKAIMNSDPAVAKGVMSGTLHPYKVAFKQLCP